ncbi:MAG: class C beta-lactamase-related serine hydrolase, partial [Alphaproteobacteria bacterium]
IKSLKFLIIYISLTFYIVLNLNVQANENSRWPLPDWETLDNSNQMETKECRDFKKLAVNSDTFLTDGLVVIKDGLIHYEYYDSKHGPSTPHALWSISKTITGILLGITERDGRISFDSELTSFYSREKNDENYKKITVKNLFYMDAGYIWEEGIKDTRENPLVNMLYGSGHKDMAIYAINRKLSKEGPTYKWNYSTGLPTITMGILKKIYGIEDDSMPWRSLFNPLGMNSAVFERDVSGTFVGGSSAFNTPRDLAKIGYLFLNNGIWNGEILLPSDWIQKMLTPSPGYLSPGTIIKDITKVGVYGGSIWLNKETKKGKGRPYPNVPEDMYMALGFMGQLLIILPSQKMIIVRTGHDSEYHSKTNEFISRAIQCFHDPNHKIGKSRPGNNPLEMSIGKLIRNVKNAIQANTLQGSIAKTICSCHYVTGLDIPACIKRNNFTLAKLLTKITVTETKEFTGEMSINVKLSKFARLFKHHRGDPVKAYYDPMRAEFGCTLK